jgi:hypothetical protein
VAEAALDRLPQRREAEILVFDGDRSGLDLGEVEDVRDEVQQVRAGRVDGAGILDLAVRKIAFAVLRELLPEDEDAV